MNQSQMKMHESKTIVLSDTEGCIMDYAKMSPEDSIVNLKYLTPEVSLSVLSPIHPPSRPNTARRGKKWSMGQRRRDIRPMGQSSTNGPSLTTNTARFVPRKLNSSVSMSNVLNPAMRQRFPITKKPKPLEHEVIVIEDSDSDDECQIVCVTYPRKPLIMAPEINRKKPVKISKNYDDDVDFIVIDGNNVPSIGPRPVRSCRARRLRKEKVECVLYPDFEPDVSLPDKLDKELFFNSLGLSKNGLPVSDPLKPLPYKSTMPSMMRQHASKCLTIVQVPKMVECGMLPKKAMITKEQLSKSAEFIKDHTLTKTNYSKKGQCELRKCVVLVQRLSDEEIIRLSKKEN